ncbi:MAG: Hpt domain-containing protein [Gammaproteobacteria bacterium]|nr:Hpt domain-containing protein [Gammaproteobacteria bacterium]
MENQETSKNEEVEISLSAEEEVDDELMAIFRESATTYQRQLTEALSQENWGKVKEIAHPIKGSGSSFGFPMLTEKANEVCDAYDNEQLEQIAGLTEILIVELDKVLT